MFLMYFVKLIKRVNSDPFASVGLEIILFKEIDRMSIDTRHFPTFFGQKTKEYVPYNPLASGKLLLEIIRDVLLNAKLSVN